MTKITGNKSTVFFNLVSLLFFVLMVPVVESRVVGTVPKAEPGLVCDEVVGVKSGDTCFAIAQQFDSTIEDFRFINPNLSSLRRSMALHRRDVDLSPKRCLVYTSMNKGVGKCNALITQLLVMQVWWSGRHVLFQCHQAMQFANCD
ncbi:hypothetical protein ACJRO7_033895 [Eucalyptus globulus]|uniref:LysM domain-containing protein n=1 Tax=Eucalyptus globulus TaxID=34317 RepID=A0ABD3J235_EUCGL